MNSHQSTLRSAALDYLASGISILPLNGKRPYLSSWKSLQHQCPSVVEVEDWTRRWPSMNVGIVTGHLSSLVVIDADSREAIEELEQRGMPSTPTVQTARGRHYYFAHPGFGTSIPNAAGLLPGVDVRGDSGYVVAPPSIHDATGMVYDWLPGLALDDVPLAPLPDWITSTSVTASAASATSPLPITTHPKTVDTETSWALLEGSRTGHALPGQLTIPAGTRNQTLTSLGGKLRRAAYPTSVLDELRRINQLACEPPLDDAEIERIARSVMRYPLGGARSRLRWLRECVARTFLGGRTALTMRRVYEAHLDIATHASRDTYTASVRQIAEKADVSVRTVLARHADLRQARLLRLVRPGAGYRASTWQIPADALLALRERTFTITKTSRSP